MAKIVAFLVSLMTLSVVSAYAHIVPKLPQDTPKVEKRYNVPKSEIQLLVSQYAFVYKVPEERILYIMEHESQFRSNAIGDMDITCKRTGLPVRARGIIQITECWYPHIPDSCAFDVECSLKEMILIIKNDELCKQQFTTCRNYLRQNPAQ